MEPLTVTSLPWETPGVFLAVANLSALFAYGNIRLNELPISRFRLAFEDALHLTPGVSPSRLFLDSLTVDQLESSHRMEIYASCLTFATLLVALRPVLLVVLDVIILKFRDCR